MQVHRNYTLDKDRRPVLEPDLLKWARWFETAERQVASDVVPNREPHYSLDKERIKEQKKAYYRLFGELRKNSKLDDPKEILISTVFLGLDHQWMDGPPLLFETMVFNGPCNEFQERYSTWKEAEEGHKK